MFAFFLCVCFGFPQHPKSHFQGCLNLQKVTEGLITKEWVWPGSWQDAVLCCLRSVHSTLLPALRGKDPWYHSTGQFALWARGWSGEGKLRSCWMEVLGTAITVARGAPLQDVLVETGGPPMFPNSGDVQAARFRTFCWLCAWVSHCLFFFFFSLSLKRSF